MCVVGVGVWGVLGCGWVLLWCVGLCGWLFFVGGVGGPPGGGFLWFPGAVCVVGGGV